MSRLATLFLFRNSAFSPRRTITGQNLGEFGPLANSRTLPVKDIDGDRDQECETSKNGGGPLKMVFTADVLINCPDRVSENYGKYTVKKLTGSRVQSRYASE